MSVILPNKQWLVALNYAENSFSTVMNAKNARIKNIKNKKSVNQRSEQHRHLFNQMDKCNSKRVLKTCFGTQRQQHTVYRLNSKICSRRKSFNYVLYVEDLGLFDLFLFRIIIFVHFLHICLNAHSYNLQCLIEFV